jgi:hypothetical protein
MQQEGAKKPVKTVCRWFLDEERLLARLTARGLKYSGVPPVETSANDIKFVCGCVSRVVSSYAPLPML